MKYGSLSSLFEGVGAKRLTAVEIDPDASTQHEFQGVASFRKILGEDRAKVRFKARYVWLSDDDFVGPSVEAGTLTWSNVRARQAAKRRPEWHAYYTANFAVEQAHVGDLLVIAKEKGDNVRVLIARRDSTAESQLCWLFGLQEAIEPGKAEVRDFSRRDLELSLTGRFLLEELGVEAPGRDSGLLEAMVEEFGNAWPRTKDLSEFTRKSLKLDAMADPDAALIGWFEQEELLFRTLEKHLLKGRFAEVLKAASEPKVDELLDEALSAIQRRRSRAGHALEHHVKAILDLYDIDYDQKPRTEGKAEPDFLFPGIKQYLQEGFDKASLHMLGVKTTCKDRWRQVLAEADKIDWKHVLTLEPAISVDQTNEMNTHHVRLVVPKTLHTTYKADQQRWLLSVSDFLRIVA